MLQDGKYLGVLGFVQLVKGDFGQVEIVLFSIVPALILLPDPC